MDQCSNMLSSHIVFIWYMYIDIGVNSWEARWAQSDYLWVGCYLNFVTNFWNIEKNKLITFYFLLISCFLRVLCYFQHF